jgi:hypothetical protein
LNDTNSPIAVAVDGADTLPFVFTRVVRLAMLFARLLSPDAGNGQPSTNGGAEMFGFGLGHAPSAAVTLASRSRVPEIKPFIKISRKCC